VFSDKLVFDNGPVYLNECYAIVKEHLHSQTCYVEGTEPSLIFWPQQKKGTLHGKFPNLKTLGVNEKPYTKGCLLGFTNKIKALENSTSSLWWVDR
jgi:hypothetical protein